VDTPIKLFASVLALTGFAVALVAGLASGADSASTLKRAMLSMLVCYAVGAALGAIAGHAISEYLRGYAADRPAVSMDEAIASYVIEEDDE